MRFENKVAIVTGSGGGIAQAYAEALAISIPVDVFDPESGKAMAWLYSRPALSIPRPTGAPPPKRSSTTWSMLTAGR